MVFGSSLLSSTKKKDIKVGPFRQNFLDPRMQLGKYVLCAKSAFMRQGHHMLPNSQNNNSTWPDSSGFNLRHHAVLETSTLSLWLRLIILADSLGPDLARPTKCLMFLFITKALIRLCAMCKLICNFVGLMQQCRGTYIYRRVVRKASSYMSQSSQ